MFNKKIIIILSLKKNLSLKKCFIFILLFYFILFINYLFLFFKKKKNSLLDVAKISQTLRNFRNAQFSL